MTGGTRVDALIFDVDGTLADTEELHRCAFNAAFGAHGLEWHWSPEQYVGLLEITGGKERIAAFLERQALPAAERRRIARSIADIHRTKTRLYTQLIAEGGLPARPGVLELLSEARERGVRLAIASTTSPENVQALLAGSLGARVEGWFSAIATGDVVAQKKPAPDIYHLALKELGIDPPHGIAFEDSAIGVQAARAAGLYTVASPTRWTRHQDFSAAQLVLPSLAERHLGELAALHADHFAH